MICEYHFNDHCPGLVPDSPVSLPMRSPRAKLDTGKRSASVMAGLGGQAGGQNNPSVEDLSDFLSKMDSCIAVNKRAADCLIKSSALEPEAGERDAESLNNTHTRSLAVNSY